MLTASRPSAALEVSWLIRRHHDEVLAIEEDSFVVPWSADELRAYFWPANALGYVALIDGRVAGYICFSWSRCAYLIENLAVAAQWRRRGIASALVDRIKRKLAQSEKRVRIETFVWDENPAAQLFFRAQGFKCTSISRGHFADEHDAYRFVLRKEAGP